MNETKNTTNEGPRIIRLQVDNVKRLRAIDITPGRHLMVIGGKNDQGKSSVLDAITWLLGGAKALPEVPVRVGEKSAKIVADLGDLVVTRTITAAGGGSLTVKTKDGASYTSPQAILDKLTGKLTFDPLAFTLLKPAEQLEALMRLTGLSFAEEQKQRDGLYVERTNANRSLDAAAAVLLSMPAHDATAPAQEVSVADLVAKLEAAQTTNENARRLADAARDAQGAVMEAQREVDGVDRTIGGVEAEIARLQHRLTELKASRDTKAKTVEELQTAAAAAEKLAVDAPTVDAAPIRQELAGAALVNQRVERNAKRMAQQASVDGLKARVDELTKAIEHMDAQKRAKIAAAKFPVEGLSLSDTGVVYNGVPFAQASSAVKIRVSVAMAVALNPKLKVMLIRDGSLLDEDSLAQIAALAEEHDTQVWVERVGKGAECAVIIDDGSVAPAAEVNAA